MVNLKWISLIIVLFTFALSECVWARGGHGHRHSHFSLGIGIGGYSPGFYGSGYYGSGFYGSSFYGPGFYGYRSFGYPDPFFYRPFYNYPPPVIVPVTPPVYIQQAQPKPAEPQINYWHYCQDPDGYYPYVRNCPGGWLQVAPQLPAQ